MIELIVVGVVAGLLAGISPCILPVLPAVLIAGAARPAGPRAPENGPDKGAPATTGRAVTGHAAAVAATATAAAPAASAPATTGPASAGPAMTGPATAGPARAGPARTGPARTGTPRTTTGPDGPATRADLARALATVGGLVLSFSLLVLAGSEFLSLFHLPQDSLRDAGIALLALVGLGYLIPPVGALLERPFARLGTRRPSGRAGGFVLGLALGLVYVPCAGPILAAITVVGATHRVGLTAVILTAAFAVGTAVPMLAIAIAGGQLTGRIGALRRRAPRIRQAGGALLIVIAVAVAANAFASLQRDIPGYSDALQGSASVRHQLNTITGARHTNLTSCHPTATLVNCGPAPNFTGITAWLNTPGGRPLSLAQLRGRVVLVDFWTYSCINCQRTLPHVEAWYREYAKYGLVVIGVHTPEFAFEHVVSNVRSQAAALGVRYPVAIDDNYDTWNAYDNEYWPADYLIDAQGNVRHVNFGEGDYTTTEALIRQLLVAAHPGLALPRATDVPNLTPAGEMSPETYVGYDRAQYLDPSSDVVPNTPSVYHFPPSLPLGALGLSGTWTDNAEEATAGPGAKMELGFLARDVYLVIGGSGTLSVSENGHHLQTITVGGIPRLYTLYQAYSQTSGVLQLQASPGVQAYDFTFG
jgi:cytochrome c biogenesis protein CcdA/thiol-disulfide isomerase/thioredoxin